MTPILDGSDLGDGSFEDRSFEEANKHFNDEVELVADTPTYPTDWHLIDNLLEVECRQLSYDTFELRSASHTLTISKVGFDLYRDNTIAGQVIFENWLDKNGILPVPREDKQPTIELPEATNES